MVYIHGGYWNAGDKSSVGNLSRLFTDSGMVFVSVNYRLSPNPIDTLSPTAVRFPIHPRDCARAVRWVYDSIPHYSGDRTRISLIGHSAGAHLVLLLSANPSFLQDAGVPAGVLRATCALDCGVFDVAGELRQAGGFLPRRAPIINAFGRDSSLYPLASPQVQVRRGRPLPPMLLVHQDTPDRVSSHVRFRDSVLASGSPHAYLFNARPYDHAAIALMLGDPADSIGETETVMAFVRRFALGTAAVWNTPGERLPPELPAIHAFPNPTNASATIIFTTAGSGLVRILIVDASGRLFRRLVDGMLGAGTHRVYFDADQVASGVYFCRLQTPGGQATTKLLIQR
jgi:acetyl esterase/lipase